MYLLFRRHYKRYIWLLRLFMLWTGCTASLGREDDIYVADGDVIEPRMDDNSGRYMTTYKQSWLLDDDCGHWLLLFDYLDIEDSDNCTYDYLLINEADKRVPEQRYCGNLTSSVTNYTSTSSRVNLTFVSDSMFTEVGFRIHVYHILEKANEGQSKTNDEEERERLSIFFALMGVAATAICLVCILLIYNCTLKNTRSQDTKSEIYYSSSSSESSGSSTEISSGTFTRLVSGKRQKKEPNGLRSSGKRYSKRKSETDQLSGHLVVDLGQGVTTFGNHAVEKGPGFTVSTHHNNVYYYDE